MYDLIIELEAGSNLRTVAHRAATSAGLDAYTLTFKTLYFATLDK